MRRHRLGDTTRAFITALKMTVRGEKPASLIREEENAPLLAWCRATVGRVKAIADQAAPAHLDTTKIILHIEGRDISLKTALAAVRFHAVEEYPSLVRHGGGYARLGITAANLNDRYALLRFAQLSDLPAALREEIAALGDHLANIPPE
jgi:hypothetical protein